MTEAAYAGAVAFLVALLIGPSTIRFLTKLKFGQTIREDGPQSHLTKQGTPTMGGLIIIVSVTIATALFTPTYSLVVWALFVTLGFGLVGLADDFIIVVKRRSLGLKARQKLAVQLLVSAIVAVFAYTDPRIGSTIVVPWGSGLVDLGAAFVPVAIVAMMGASNGVNLTDGLDGLAAGATAIASLAFAAMMYMSGHVDLAVFAASIGGACLGFSWFNAHPAQVFMGDTGSLALGGALGVLSVLSKTELFLVIVGGVFVAETVSVMLQVGWFKLRHRRIFRMAPIHHHFELVGWRETKVVVRFWIVGFVFAALGVALYTASVKI